MNSLPDNYIRTLTELKDRVRQAQYKSLVAVNSEMIMAYLDIGKTISELTKHGWGTSVIDRLSRDLQAEFVGMKGFSSRSLHRMKLVYESIEENEISPKAVAKIPWGHISLIFSKLKKKEEQVFYLEKSFHEGWSRSVLEEKIKFDFYSNNWHFNIILLKQLSQKKFKTIDCIFPMNMTCHF